MLTMPRLSLRHVAAVRELTGCAVLSDVHVPADGHGVGQLTAVGELTLAGKRCAERALGGGLYPGVGGVVGVCCCRGKCKRFWLSAFDEPDCFPCLFLRRGLPYMCHNHTVPTLAFIFLSPNFTLATQRKMPFGHSPSQNLLFSRHSSPWSLSAISGPGKGIITGQSLGVIVGRRVTISHRGVALDIAKAI